MTGPLTPSSKTRDPTKPRTDVKHTPARGKDSLFHCLSLPIDFKERYQVHADSMKRANVGPVPIMTMLDDFLPLSNATPCEHIMDSSGFPDTNAGSAWETEFVCICEV